MGAEVNGAVDGREPGRVGEYLDRVAARDVRGARTLVLSELGGSGLTAVIEDLLVPAMVEVGDRWYDGRWNAAQEHVACGITESALSAASVRARRSRPATDAPSVVVACPEGEAHVLPARFAAELLVEAGADVIVLGLPVPARDLGSFLAETRPRALVLSCTEPAALPGVRDAVAAAHAAGTLVLAGGAGMGADERRSWAVGADGWADQPAKAVDLLRGWGERPPPPGQVAPEDREVAALRRLRDSFIDDVFRALVARVDAVRGYRDRQAEQARDDLRQIVRHLSCALLVVDDRLFADWVQWSRRLLQARDVPVVALDESLVVIDDALGPGFPGAHRMLGAALELA